MEIKNPLENYIISLLYGIMYDLNDEKYSLEMRLELAAFILKEYDDYK